MCLFFAAFATQWCYATDTNRRAGAGACMLVAAILVAWCIWTARDRGEFWWFQSDPNQVEHIEDDDENKTPAGLDLLHEVKMLWSRRLRVRALPCESHAMQDTTSLHLHDPPNIPEP